MTIEYENKCVERDEHDKIIRILRTGLLDYFNKMSKNTLYNNTLSQIDNAKLVTLIKNNYPNVDITQKFFDNNQHEGAKLVYALKFSEIKNINNIKQITIDKYIEYNQLSTRCINAQMFIYK